MRARWIRGGLARGPPMRIADHQSAGAEVVVAAPQQIAHHAATVTELSGRVLGTSQATLTVALDTASYGQMCSFLPGLLSPLQERIAQVTRMTGEALETTGAALRTVAGSYVAADEAADLRHQILLNGRDG